MRASPPVVAGAAADTEAGLHADLARLLARLGQPSEGRAPDALDGARQGLREVVERPPLGRVTGLLDAIDETVLPRSLIVHTRAGAALCLDVCNRRLLQVRPLAQDTVLRGAADRAGAGNLTYAGGSDLMDLRSTFDALAAEGALWIETAPPRPGVTLEQTGVSVAALRRAWSDPPTPVAASLTAFVAKIAARTIAAAVLERPGAQVEILGDPEMGLALADAVAGDWPWPDSGAPFGARLLRPGAEGEAALLWLEHGEGRGVAALAAGQAEAVLQAWAQMHLS